MRSWYADDIHQPFTLTTPGNQTGALLVHGFTGSPADLRAVADAVHAHGIDVHVMALPGMAADIEHLNEMTGAIWREAVADQWREVAGRYDRTLLLGYSLGGALAVLTAVERPPDLLVLLAPLSRLADRRSVLLPLLKHVVPAVRPYGRLDWSDTRVHAWFDAVRPSMRTRDPINQQVMQRDVAYGTRMLDEMRRLTGDVRRLAPRVSGTSVVIQGVDDDIVLPRDTHRLVDRLGGTVYLHDVEGDHYLPLPGCGWWPEVRQVLDGELAQWLTT